MLISESYSLLNERLHNSAIPYGAGGYKWVDSVIALTEDHNTIDVLDYGCGKSTLAEMLPFSIQQYDPCIPEHRGRPKPADIVVCTDVLEHVEPECLDSVLSDILYLMNRCGFLFIATCPAKKRLPDGRNTHLIQKPAGWWINKLQTRFEVMSEVNHVSRGVVLVVSPL